MRQTRPSERRMAERVDRETRSSVLSDGCVFVDWEAAANADAKALRVRGKGKGRRSDHQNGLEKHDCHRPSTSLALHLPLTHIHLFRQFPCQLLSASVAPTSDFVRSFVALLHTKPTSQQWLKFPLSSSSSLVMVVPARCVHPSVSISLCPSTCASFSSVHFERATQD